MSSLKTYSGVPGREAYHAVLNADEFHEIETYSNQFIYKHQSYLARYARKWVLDPLHQWSRQWEYPFVFNALKKANVEDGARILDAGSGISFFPFLIAQQLRATVTCCDVDPLLPTVYTAIGQQEAQVDFFVRLATIRVS